MVAVNEKDLGSQPLDGVMTRLGVSNADLVAGSSEQLSFKVVQKGRKGRRLTPGAQKKILRALRVVHPGEVFELGKLFSY